MQPLIALRNCSNNYVNDLLWPSLTPALTIRMEKGEILRWRGVVGVCESRRVAGEEQVLWKFTEPANCIITDRRIIYYGIKIAFGKGALAKSIQEAGLRPTSSPASKLTGQVRFDWVGCVELTNHSVQSRDSLQGSRCFHLGFLCQQGAMVVEITLNLNQRTCGRTVGDIATGLAHAIVSDIARYRLSVRNNELTAKDTEQLTKQRDSPSSDASGMGRWSISRGLQVGGGTKAVATKKRFTAQMAQAISLMERYEKKGETKDLEACFKLSHELIEDAVFGGISDLLARNYYAGTLRARFDRFGDLGDLSAVISVMRSLIAEVRSEAPEMMSGWLSNLGSALDTRYQRVLDEADLAEAVSFLEEAAEAAGDDRESWALAASNLSQTLRTRFPLTEDLSDLDRAIELCEDIERLTGDLSYLPNLGHALLDRYRARCRQDDLDRAIRIYRAALEGPHSAENRATLERALAYATSQLPDAGSGQDRQAATAVWRRVCADSHSSSPAVLQAAQSWTSAAAEWGDWEGSSQACDAGLSAAERLRQIQLSVEHKSSWLEEAAGLSARGAYARAKLGQLSQAVTLLEHGRTVLVSETFSQGRADLDRLVTAGRDDLQERYDAALAKIAQVEHEDNQARRSTYSAWRELNKVISAIQQIPGFEDFCARPGFSNILSAAEKSMLVYIAYTEVGGLALMVDGRPETSPDVQVIWLDQLTESAVTDAFITYLRSYDGRMSRQPIPGAKDWLESLDDITRWLWNTVMGPLLRAFPEGRLTLIPGGVLGLLPLHAAWHKDATTPTGRRYALDDALITYAASAESLRDAALRVTSIPSMCAVADTSLPNSLPEVQEALHWFRHGRCLDKDEIRLSNLQDALTKASVLHFSCHGYVDLMNPLESNLRAASDGNLTLKDIYKLRLSDTRLAVLSACETSLTGTIVPDEVIGLPAGFLGAGVQGVVGSMWPVGDAVTRALMSHFYDKWQHGNLEIAEALRQAQQWVRDTTPSEKMSAYPGPDWPGIDTGSRPLGSHGLIHSHPTHWAAFQFFGT